MGVVEAKKKELEACRMWLREFSMIPVALLEKAYPYGEGIEVLAPTIEQFREEYYKENCIGEVCEECYSEHCSEQYNEEIPFIPMWGWVFAPNSSLDAEWIKRNASKIYEECGIIVYETDEIGVFLGINGAGYDFYETHWLPLYRLRGLKWHENF